MSNAASQLIRLNILTILIGLSIQKGVEEIIKHFSWTILFNGLAFLLVALLFYHGKITTTESEHHKSQIQGRAWLTFVDYILNVAVIGTFVVMPYFLKQTSHYLTVNVILRFADLILLAATISSRKIEWAAEKKAHFHWLFFNSISGIVYTLLLLWSILSPKDWDFLISLIVFAIAVLDVLTDYWRNAKFYLGGPPTHE